MQKNLREPYMEPSGKLKNTKILKNTKNAKECLGMLKNAKTC